MTISCSRIWPVSMMPPFSRWPWREDGVPFFHLPAHVFYGKVSLPSTYRVAHSLNICYEVAHSSRLAMPWGKVQPCTALSVYLIGTKQRDAEAPCTARLAAVWHGGGRPQK